MSTDQLAREAMALPLAERVSLAQALWQSIAAGLTDETVTDALRDAVQRDNELSAGAVSGRLHDDDVMRAARGSLGCA